MTVNQSDGCVQGNLNYLQFLTEAVSSSNLLSTDEIHYNINSVTVLAAIFFHLVFSKFLNAVKLFTVQGIVCINDCVSLIKVHALIKSFDIEAQM